MEDVKAGVDTRVRSDSVERLELPFMLRGHRGQVRAQLRTNDDPVASGHALVAKNFDPVAFRGFPVARASIEYDGPGLNAAMGWVQVIRHYDARGGELASAVDRSPFGLEDAPFYAVGYLPTFFDAPANPDHLGLTWVAFTWLVASPTSIDSRSVSPITGFRWGYRLGDALPPMLVPLAPLEHADWLGLLGTLRAACPNWSFNDEWMPSS